MGVGAGELWRHDHLNSVRQDIVAIHDCEAGKIALNKSAKGVLSCAGVEIAGASSVGGSYESASFIDWRIIESELKAKLDFQSGIIYRLMVDGLITLASTAFAITTSEALLQASTDHRSRQLKV